MKLKFKIFDSNYHTPRSRLVIFITGFIFIIAAIAMCSLSYVNFNYISPTWNQCEESQEIKELEFYGIVSDKVYDKEFRNSQYLKITDNTKGKFTLSLEYEILKLVKTGNSITWELINIGDSVKKEPNTFIISYKNPKSKNWESRELAFPDCTE